jgi:hypothetical protein
MQEQLILTPLPTASADVYNVSAFQLPDPNGRAGGACTSALLQVLYKDRHQNQEKLTWVELLRRMRTVLGGMGYDQIPQLTSSRLIDVGKTMYIVPPGATGTKRAILIGINYEGQQGQLSGCHNDASNMGDYLEKVHDFSRANMLILMDDGINHTPTKQNIMNAFERITQYCQAGDVVFLHYSGKFKVVDDEIITWHRRYCSNRALLLYLYRPWQSCSRSRRRRR